MFVPGLSVTVRRTGGWKEPGREGQAAGQIRLSACRLPPPVPLLRPEFCFAPADAHVTIFYKE